MNADPEVPGYKHIIFKPQPAGEITDTHYSNLTPYGNASVSWKKDQGKFIMDIIVPVGSSATAYVPVSGSGAERKDRKKSLRQKGVDFKGTEEGYAVYKTGSGNYRFEAELPGS
jgi:alpha-L-rhamnosidase